MGIVQKRPRQGNPLLIPTRELPHGSPGPLAQVEEVEHYRHPRCPVAQAEELAGEFQVFARGEFAIKERGVGNESDGGLRGGGMGKNVGAVIQNLAFARARKSGEHPQQRGFARAIRPVEQDGVTRFDAQ